MPIDVVAAGTLLYRIHRTAQGAVYFRPRAKLRDRGRWDAAESGFGVCYLAEAPHGAFVETFLRDLDLDHIAAATLAARNLVYIEVTRELSLVKMHGEGLRRLRATGAVVQGPYATTWAWSEALHAHRDAVDGIRYRARHDDDAFTIAVYDRASDALSPARSIGLLDPRLAQELASWMSRYAIGLGP